MKQAGAREQSRQSEILARVCSRRSAFFFLIFVAPCLVLVFWGAGAQELARAGGDLVRRLGRVGGGGQPVLVGGPGDHASGARLFRAGVKAPAFFCGESVHVSVVHFFFASAAGCRPKCACCSSTFLSSGSKKAGLAGRCFVRCPP